MTNQTPPAWANKAASEIVEYAYPDYKDRIPGLRMDISQSISKYAPDAESLAVALEEALEEMKSWQIDWERMSDDSGYNPSFSEPTNKASMALSQYRARFPKAQENAR